RHFLRSHTVSSHSLGRAAPDGLLPSILFSESLTLTRTNECIRCLRCGGIQQTRCRQREEPTMKISALCLLVFLIGAGTALADPIEPETRPPLGPFDQTGPDGLIVHTDLPPNQIPLPNEPNLRGWRGNAWSVTIPGLPFVPGGSSIHPERAI